MRFEKSIMDGTIYGDQSSGEKVVAFPGAGNQGTSHDEQDRRFIASILAEDSPHRHEMVSLLIRAYRSLYGRTEDDTEKIMQWLLTFNRDLRAVPMDVIRQTDDVASVARYLDQIRG